MEIKKKLPNKRYEVIESNSEFAFVDSEGSVHFVSLEELAVAYLCLLEVVKTTELPIMKIERLAFERKKGKINLVRETKK